MRIDKRKREALRKEKVLARLAHEKHKCASAICGGGEPSSSGYRLEPHNALFNPAGSPAKSPFYDWRADMSARKTKGESIIHQRLR